MKVQFVDVAFWLHPVFNRRNWVWRSYSRGNRCEANRSARATFHHNRFSCEVPSRISKTSDIHATVVMGNMVGHGRELDVPWISAEENQAFLYYSPKIWNDQMSLAEPSTFCRLFVGFVKRAHLKMIPRVQFFEVLLP